MSKSRAETETIIRRSAADDSWVVFSEDPVIIRKMTRLYGAGRTISAVGVSWSVPLAAVGLRKPRVYTDEQRAKSRDRLMVARKSVTSKNLPADKE